MKILIQYLFISLFALISNNTFGQYHIQTCEEAGIGPQMIDQYGPDPDRETDLMSIYFPTGSTTADCIVFSKTGRNDRVIIPGDWTVTPNADRLRGIDATFDAMDESRIYYNTFGEVDWIWYTLLNGNQFNDNAEAYNVNDECWTRNDLFMDTETEAFTYHKYVTAHELGHCYLMENYDRRRVSPSGVTQLAHVHEWMDESAAELLASSLYDDTNFEHSYARQFQLEDTSFMQLYNAYTVLTHHANNNSIQETLDEIVRESYYKRQNQLISMYRNIDFDESLHNFYFHHYQKNVNDKGGGKIPRETDVEIHSRYELLPPNGGLTLETIESEKLTVFELLVPGDYDLIINFPINASDEAFYSIIADEQKIEDWTKRETIKGYCGSEKRVLVLTSHLNDSAVTGAEIEYELKEREGCCTTSSSLGTTGSTGSPVVTANPSELDKQFHFDYAIESDIRIIGGGETMNMEADYFVNSKDGSMLFFKEFLMINFDKTSNDQYDFHAAVWMPNGQMVAYVYDKRTDTNRAITIATDQTRQDVVRSRSSRVLEFLRESRSSSLDPAPLPAGSRWVDQSTGHAAMQSDFPGSPDMNKVSVYFSNDATPISSPMNAFGFMVGYAKDHQRRNKLLVYHKTELEDGSTMEAELNSILKDCRTFNGNGYEPMTLIGDQGRVGSMSQAEREDLVQQAQDYQEQVFALFAELGDCGSDATCQADVKSRMLELQRQREENFRNLPSNPNYSGLEGTEHENEEMAITNQMYLLEQQRIDKELECSRKGEAYANCSRAGGGAACIPLDRAWQACNDEVEAIRELIEEEQCALAQLKGMAHLMEDCY